MGKSGELGKLLAGKCWYLEGNFGIWKEIVHFCTQKHIDCLNLEACLPGNYHFSSCRESFSIVADVT